MGVSYAWVVVPLIGAAAIGFALRLPGPPRHARTLAAVQLLLLLAAAWSFSVLSWDGAGAALGGAVLSLALAAMSSLERFCLRCGHRERWSRFLEPPRHCSYCRAAVDAWWRLPAR